MTYTAPALYDNISGVILAGGKSSRMGVAKANLCVGDKTIIERVAAVFRSLFIHNLIVARDACVYHNVGFPIYLDSYPETASIVGLHAAIKNNPTEYAFCAACDMPFLNEGVIRFLASKIDDRADVIIPVLEDGPQPLHAIFRKSCLGVLTKRCEEGHFALRGALDDLNVLEVKGEEFLECDPWMLSFSNCNTPQEFERVREIAAEFDL